MLRFIALFTLFFYASISQSEEHLLFSLPFSDNQLHATVSGQKEEPIYQEKIAFNQGLGPGDRPAVSIPVDGQLIYEGSGSYYLPSGALSFWWRPDATPLKVETPVFSLSSAQRFYFCRWLRITTKNSHLALTLYHGNSADVLSDGGSVPAARKPGKKTQHQFRSRQKLKKGEWVHIVVNWDYARGVALYVNGKLDHANKTPWFFGGHANHVNLGGSSTSYSKPRPASFPQSFADVAIFDQWLSEDAVAALYRGEKAILEDNLGPMLAERAQRIGLGKDEALPVACSAPDAALHLTQLGVESAYDVLRKSYSALDGDPGRAWPMYQGYSGSGKTLRIKLDATLPLNSLQAFGSGRMRFRALAASGQSEVLQLDAALPSFAASLPQFPQGAESVEVERDDGVLFNITPLNQSEHPFPEAGAEGWAFVPLQHGAAESQPEVAREFPPYDRTLLSAADSPATPTEGTHRLPAQRAIHLLGPTSSQQTGLGAVALDLALPNAPESVACAVMVVDPVNSFRRAFSANVRFDNTSQMHRARLVIDLRDLVYEAGQAPRLVLYFDQPLEIDLAQSRLGLRTLPVATAKEEFVADQFHLVQDRFQELSESRPWAHDPKKLKFLASLLNSIDAIRALEPGNPVFDGYWHWTHPTQPTPTLALPTAPPSPTPPWALYTHRAISNFRDVAHWWIDHRQTENGEFGAPDGINDDTDIIQDWLAIDLMHGPDEKIRRSVDKVADISWRLTTTDGISNKVTDTLHMYEWGINAQTLAFVLRYGDPVYYTRLLRFASHYPELMSEACEGKHVHFKSWYFGANQIVTEGIYGRDTLLNALLLQPAMLLAWYNGDEEATRLLARWTASMQDHITEAQAQTKRLPGVAVEMPSGKTLPQKLFNKPFAEAVWASYLLTGEERFRDFAGALIDLEITRRPLLQPHATAWIAGGYLAATADNRWDTFWQKEASAPTLWQRSLHNANYRELNSFYAAWLRTGDDKWLDEGSRLALYHLEWSLPMLTVAEATTDRVWLPQTLANQTTLGGLPILRNRTYPSQAVSWEHATGAFTPLVRHQKSDHLKIELWNLEETPVKVDARLWTLAAGEYEVTYTATIPHNQPTKSPLRKAAQSSSPSNATASCRWSFPPAAPSSSRHANA